MCGIKRGTNSYTINNATPFVFLISGALAENPILKNCKDKTGEGLELCPFCKGLGYLIFRGIGTKICSKCNGAGKIKKEKK